MPLKILHIPNNCTGCGACVSVCSKQALSLKSNREGFYFPELDAKLCVDCKLCEKVCHCLNTKEDLEPSANYKAFMVKANSHEVVMNSSSGGVFSLLADMILKQGGVVYGARYNFQEECLEQGSTDTYPLEELRKSKYIESFMGQVIKDVHQSLKNGRMVLFCGTPCQVEGVRQYLLTRKVDMSNLLLVRFICHGVPSNKFFTEYKHYEEAKHKSKMTAFDFRPKVRGWRSSDWKMCFENGKIETGPYYYYYYYYYYYFQMCNTLRASCYLCKRVFNENADITIGDFWGIQKYCPDNKDQEGISVLLAHNDKALEYVKSIQEHSMVMPIPMSAVDYIYREATERSKFLDERNEIMKQVVEQGYMAVAKKRLGRDIMKRKIKDRIAKYIRPLRKWIKRK